MKAIVCELCGSNDIVKQDGLYVCQHCGTKYTLEEARKLMNDSEEPVSVKLDNSAQIKNSLVIARSACKSGNYKEAESYANKILEMDPSCAEAWEIKGIAAGWQSTLGNIRFGESIECWSKAFDLSDERGKEILKKRIGPEMSNLVISLVKTRANHFASLPSESSYNELSDSTTVFDLLAAFIVKIGADVIDIDDILGKCAVIMRDAAVEGERFSNHSYGPEKSDKTKYAYTTWLERMGYCINILVLAIPLAQDESTVDLIFSTAKAMQTSVIYSECYRFETNGYTSEYVKDYSLNANAKAMKESEIREWERSKNAQIRKIKGKESAKRREEEKKKQEEINNYWDDHFEERKIIEKAKGELIQLKKDNPDLAKAIDADAGIQELDSILTDKNESRIKNIIAVIQGKGIVESRKKLKYLELKRSVELGKKSFELKQTLDGLTLLEDYEDCSELRTKCEELLKKAEKKERDWDNLQAQKLMNEFEGLDDVGDLEHLKVSLSSFKQCEALEEYNKKIDDKIVSLQTKENDKKLKKKKTGTIIKIAVAAVIVISLFFAIFGKRIIQSVTNAKLYKQADTLFEQGSYAEARTIFIDLSTKGYRDSVERIKQCKYGEAQADFENQKYNEAKVVYQSLKDTEKIKECDYELGKQELNAGDYDKAIGCFNDANGYLDSKEMISECKYQKGLAFYKANKVEGAVAVFEEIIDYKDVSDILLELYYLQGKKAFEENNYEKALECFTKSVNYEDSKALIEKMDLFIENDKLFQSALAKSQSFTNPGNTDKYIEQLSEEYLSHNKEARAFVDAWEGVDRNFFNFCVNWRGYEVNHPERKVTESFHLKYENGNFKYVYAFRNSDMYECELEGNKLHTTYDIYVLSPDKKTLKYYMGDTLISVCTKN